MSEIGQSHVSTNQEGCLLRAIHGDLLKLAPITSTVSYRPRRTVSAQGERAFSLASFPWASSEHGLLVVTV